MLGVHREGEDVLLLAADGGTCLVKTGKAAGGRHPSADPGDAAEPATALVGACAGDAAPEIAAIGVRPETFSRVSRTPVEGRERERVLARVDADGALGRMFEEARRGGGVHGSDDLHDRSRAEVFTLATVPQSPAFVRYRFRGGPTGPVLVVARDRISAPFLPCSDAPAAISLGRRTFVYAWSGACATGVVGWLVYELEGGTLRDVFVGFELAD